MCTSLNAKNKLTIMHALTVRSGIQRGSPPLLLLYVWLGNKFIWAWCINSDSGVDCRTNRKHAILLLLGCNWTSSYMNTSCGQTAPLQQVDITAMCSTGINHFWLVGFFLFCWQKNLFQLIWSINFFRVFIRSRVPGTGTRLLWTECPATQSAKLKKTARK